MTQRSSASTALARRLWEHHARGASSAADVAAAADRCFAALAVTLVRWIGVAGYRALLKRAIALDGSGQAALADIALRNGDGSASLAVVSALGAEATMAAVTGLLATIAGLLARVVGEPVALRLLEQAGPARSEVRRPSPNSGFQRNDNG
jgi:hypothetical protein